MQENDGGYEYRGRWIESYDHTFGRRTIRVWRVRTKKAGAILSKHLPTEKLAKQAAEAWGEQQDVDE